MNKQRYKYEVIEVWGEFVDNEQVKVGTVLVDVEKHDEEGIAEWNIWNFDKHEITGGFVGKLLGEFEEPAKEASETAQ